MVSLRKAMSLPPMKSTPGTAPPLQRLRAVRELVDAGINAGVLMNPIVPGFSSSRAKIERTIKAIADHGARFVGCNVMFLEDGTRTHFMKFLEREFPSWVPRYEKLYVKKYAPQEYRKQIQGMVRLLQDRYGFPEITETDKRRILGENQAKLFGIDVAQKKRELVAAA